MSSERETLKVQSCLFEVTPSPPSVQRTVARTEAKTHEDAARRPADDVTDDDSADVGGGAPAGRPVASETRLTPAVGGGAAASARAFDDDEYGEDDDDRENHDEHGLDIGADLAAARSFLDRTAPTDAELVAAGGYMPGESGTAALMLPSSFDAAAPDEDEDAAPTPPQRGISGGAPARARHDAAGDDAGGAEEGVVDDDAFNDEAASPPLSSSPGGGMEAVWPRKPSDFAFSQDGGDDDERDVSFDGHGDGVAAAGGGGGGAAAAAARSRNGHVDASDAPPRGHTEAQPTDGRPRQPVATGRPHLEAFSLPIVYEVRDGADCGLTRPRVTRGCRRR